MLVYHLPQSASHHPLMSLEARSLANSVLTPPTGRTQTHFHLQNALKQSALLAPQQADAPTPHLRLLRAQ